MAIIEGAAVVGGLSLAGSVAGSSISAGGAQKAAQTEANAQQQAIQAETQMFDQGQQIQQQDLATAIAQAQQYYGTASGLEQPYAQMGIPFGNELTGEILGGQPVPGQAGPLGAMPSLTDMSQLPGYDFTLQQGLLATQNAAAAQGLGISGPAMKAASSYAENTANTFYNNYLQNYWSNQNNRYNMLAGVMNTGATAATNLGGQAVNTGLGIASAAGAAGNQALSSAVTTGGQIGGTTTSTAANIAQAQQNAANTVGAGITGGIQGGITNALLANALLSNAGSTIPSGTGSDFYSRAAGAFYTPMNNNLLPGVQQ